MSCYQKAVLVRFSWLPAINNTGISLKFDLTDTYHIFIMQYTLWLVPVKSRSACDRNATMSVVHSPATNVKPLQAREVLITQFYY